MKRRDALRKVRTICQRLDEIDPDAFFVRPFKLYLFGSVLTDKPDPADIDLALVYHDPPVHSSQEALERYADMLQNRPLPFDKATRYLKKGMKMIRFFPVEGEIAMWSQLPLFPHGDGLRLIWKPGLNWRAILDQIEAQLASWTGPRPPDAQEQAETAWNTLPREQQQAKRAQIVAVLKEQEDKLDRFLEQEP